MDHYYMKPSIGGWFTFPGLYRKMVEVAPDNAHFVEVGAYLGKSTACMGVEIANSGKKITFDVVDIWRNTPQAPVSCTDDEMFEAFKQNISSVASFVNPRRMDSVTAAGTYPDSSLDFVFIDADHSYEACLADINAWLPKVKVGGYIAGHDYFSWPGVSEAVNEAFSGKKFQAFQDENVWVYKKQED